MNKNYDSIFLINQSMSCQYEVRNRIKSEGQGLRVILHVLNIVTISPLYFKLLTFPPKI